MLQRVQRFFRNQGTPTNIITDLKGRVILCKNPQFRIAYLIKLTPNCIKIKIYFCYATNVHFKKFKDKKKKKLYFHKIPKYPFEGCAKDNTPTSNMFPKSEAKLCKLMFIYLFIQVKKRECTYEAGRELLGVKTKSKIGKYSLGPITL